MIPVLVEAHLRERYPSYAHHVHPATQTARGLAAAEHARGECVAKSVVVRVGNELALAVVPAIDRVDLEALERATGQCVELVPEREFGDQFRPCEIGAEPPLAMFGVPIYVDEELVRQPTVVMPGGTHEDALILDGAVWARCEHVRTIADLGRPAIVPSPWNG